jgi:F-type H+-transporting ATPase subunit b
MASIFLSFIELNTNILETNLINILLLFALLFYANKVSFSSTLENRQKEIIQQIENAEKDLESAKNYYTLAENGYTESVFWLQSWKSLYETQKIEIYQGKYKVVSQTLLDNFLTTEELINTFEKKAYLSLQRYIVLITGSKILRKFFYLSEKEQSKILENIIANLGGNKK